MLAPIVVLLGSIVLLITASFDFGISRGYIGPSREELSMNLERGPDFSKEDLPAVGNSGEDKTRLIGRGYFVGVVIQTIGALLYLGGV